MQRLVTKKLSEGLSARRVLGLTWERVDLAGGNVVIGWQLQRIDGKMTRVPLKSRKGGRSLPLLPIVREALERRRREQAADQLAAGKR